MNKDNIHIQNKDDIQKEIEALKEVIADKKTDQKYIDQHKSELNYYLNALSMYD